MTTRIHQWREVRHPLGIYLRGWKLGRRSIISPRGTVFETRFLNGKGNRMIARKQLDFHLSAQELRDVPY